ncbi:hypothetical protein L1887_24471 [Cichorium endivia]|nr:hypothetical protein L1887_24471 [Cichorium endivia]
MSSNQRQLHHVDYSYFQLHTEQLSTSESLPNILLNHFCITLVGFMNFIIGFNFCSFLSLKMNAEFTVLINR